MKENWLVSNIFKEMTYGFYVEFGIDNSNESTTLILDKKYKWRGIYQTDEKDIDRSKFCYVYKKNLNDYPRGLIESITDIHPGSMVHYVRINDCKTLDKVFDEYYLYNVIKPYEKNPAHLRLNIIFLELNNCDVNDDLIYKLKIYHDLNLFENIDNCYKFVNNIYEILL